jgi:hypothetical protein
MALVREEFYITIQRRDRKRTKRSVELVNLSKSIQGVGLMKSYEV